MLWNDPVVAPFPHGDPGAPVRTTTLKYEDYNNSMDPHNPWAPFDSQMEWEIAHWAKMCGPGSTAFTDLLKINGVRPPPGLLASNY
jgi:hypothetical protein